MSAQVSPAAAQDPDGDLIGGSAGCDHGLVAKTMLEQGLNVLLFGFSPILVRDAIHIAGDAYSRLPGVYSLQNLDESKATTREFFTAYREEPYEGASGRPAHWSIPRPIITRAMKVTI
jgi:branched-chain amino acid transport system substrate-binding protein